MLCELCCLSSFQEPLGLKTGCRKVFQTPSLLCGEAGIQLWVLTGDKQETAVNIAYACRLLDQTDTVYSINTENQVRPK